MESEANKVPHEEGSEAADVKTKKPRRRGKVTVFDNWCKGCGLCIAFCPQQVFEGGVDGHAEVVHGERCTACNWCYVHCPDFAIQIELIEEPAPEPKGACSEAAEVKR